MYAEGSNVRKCPVTTTQLNELYKPISHVPSMYPLHKNSENSSGHLNWSVSETDELMFIGVAKSPTNVCSARADVVLPLTFVG
jgi:hypothetical protein